LKSTSINRERSSTKNNCQFWNDQRQSDDHVEQLHLGILILSMAAFCQLCLIINEDTIQYNTMVSVGIKNSFHVKWLLVRVWIFINPLELDYVCHSVFIYQGNSVQMLCTKNVKLIDQTIHEPINQLINQSFNQPID